MTLLTIIQDVVDEVGATVRPTALIGNTDPDAQRFLRLANKVGDYLMKNYVWQALRAEQTFASVGTQEQTGAMPTNFDRFVSETFWNRTDSILLNGPVYATRWQGALANLYENTEIPLFIHRGGSVFVTPTLQAGKSMAFEYVDPRWCESSGGTPQTVWTADTDVPRSGLEPELFTYGIIAAYYHSRGFPQAAGAFNAFSDYCDTLIDNDLPAANVMVAADIFGQRSRHSTGEPPTSGALFGSFG